MLRPVLTKADFVARYQAGEFGNRAPTWNTLDEYLASGYAGGLVHIRNRVAGGPTWYNVPPDQVADMTDNILSIGMFDLYYSGMAPTERTTIQGEVYESEVGWLQLYYSTVAKPMRESLIEGGKQVQGLAALSILAAYLNQRSFDWLHWLLAAYPKHVIEFSSYDRCWGTEPGHNTVFWEVRKY